MNNSRPFLVEPGFKYFLNDTLRQCHEFKNKYHNYLMNFFLFLLFFLLVISVLVYKYKGKISDEEKHIKEREKQEYILSKIKNYQDTKRRAHQELITGLPHWDNEYDIIHDKFK